jgi:hypothetical protein
MRLLDMFGGFDREPTFLYSDDFEGSVEANGPSGGGANVDNSSASNTGGGNVGGSGGGATGNSTGGGLSSNAFSSGAVNIAGNSGAISINGGPVSNPNPGFVVAAGLALTNGVAQAILGNPLGGLQIAGAISTLGAIGLGTTIQQGNVAIGVYDPNNIGLYGTSTDTATVGSQTGGENYIATASGYGGASYSVGITPQGEILGVSQG